MSSPDTSNLNATAAATSFTVNSNPTLIRDAFAAIAAYLNAPPSTVAAHSNVEAATQTFNELVARLNEVAA